MDSGQPCSMRAGPAWTRKASGRSETVIISSLSHRGRGGVSAPRAGPHQDTSAGSYRTGCLQKVKCSQLAEVPLRSKLVPARSGLCFSQVRRCDPGAPSSLYSLSWRCKGLGGGAKSLPGCCREEILPPKGRCVHMWGVSRCLEYAYAGM